MAFEAASVKPSSYENNNGYHGGCHGIDSKYTPSEEADAPALGRCAITDARLSHLIAIAWDLRSMQLIKSDPDWIARGSERFNLEAKVADAAKATRQQLLSMLQTLLADRFQLRFHREAAEMPGFALMVAEGGTKLQESESEKRGLAFAGAQAIPMPGEPMSWQARRYSMSMLIGFLWAFGGHGAVIDKTGLEGTYDFTLSWDEDAGPSLATALQEQLGLRMESEKVPVSFFVVDSAVLSQNLLCHKSE
jgi:uncharacterized protein (TIGR03435 family)